VECSFFLSLDSSEVAAQNVFFLVAVAVATTTALVNPVLFPFRLLVFLVMSICLACTGASAEPSLSPAVAAVAKLYRAYASEAVISEPPLSQQDLLGAPRTVLEQYFDKKLTALLLEDRKCQEKEGGICKLDFVPWWDSQDPGGSELKILPTKDPTIISVEFQFPSDRSLIKLTYKVTNTPAGWRISDIGSAK
jgi:hypothetical protein